MKEHEIVREGYDKIAIKYLKNRHENLPEMKLLLQFIKRIPEEGKVLDVGCGAGVPFTQHLAEKFEVIGIDISKKQISLARQLVPNATFFQKDMKNLAFPDNSFDGILSYYAIFHVPRKDHLQIFYNFYRMLKKNGSVLLCLSTEADIGSYSDFFGEKMFWSSFDQKTNLKYLKQ
ncbi:MAG: methyltransferase domain-containing protein, partial [Candidatus Heimdallarchaeota archaeon]|nr:methyltransferase domain-containing protein [Candidatus Heimdallarchaeota archaeon]